MARGPNTTFSIILLTSLVLTSAAAASPGAGGSAVPSKGIIGPPSNTVGIRMTVSNVDPVLQSADLDLTMYTRGYGPYGTTTGGSYVAYAGSPFFGYPAIDYGDGSNVPTATLGLATSGGGPGGSNVYRSLASFSHSYPTFGSFTARSAMVCAGCFQSSYVFFPPGSPPPATFTQNFDLRPTSIIGNRPLQIPFSGSTYVSFIGTSVRYAGIYSPIVTNTAQINFGAAVPTASEWGLIAFGTLLLGAGLLLMRRHA